MPFFLKNQTSKGPLAETGEVSVGGVASLNM
jgi:hypothetical protein